MIWGCVHFFKCFFTFHFISKTQNLNVCIVSTFFFHLHTGVVVLVVIGIVVVVVLSNIT